MEGSGHKKGSMAPIFHAAYSTGSFEHKLHKGKAWTEGMSGLFVATDQHGSKDSTLYNVRYHEADLRFIPDACSPEALKRRDPISCVFDFLVSHLSFKRGNTDVEKVSSMLFNVFKQVHDIPNLREDIVTIVSRVPAFSLIERQLQNIKDNEIQEHLLDLFRKKLNDVYGFLFEVKGYADLLFRKFDEETLKKIFKQALLIDNGDLKLKDSMFVQGYEDVKKIIDKTFSLSVEGFNTMELYFLTRSFRLFRKHKNFPIDSPKYIVGYFGDYHSTFIKDVLVGMGGVIEKEVRNKIEYDPITGEMIPSKDYQCLLLNINEPLF
jgi:hypothetical protein